MLPFTAADVQQKFTAETLRRGRAYARDGSVRSVELSNDGGQLTAKVQGSSRQPYVVTVTISAKGRIDASCTCPIGYSCKHAAAAMLVALGEGRRPLPPPPTRPAPDPLAGPVAYWLETLATAAAPRAARGAGPERVLYILGRHQAGPRLEARIEPVVTRLLKAGGYGALRRYEPYRLAQRSAGFVTLEDSLIGHLLSGGTHMPSGLPDDPHRVQEGLQRILATGRCHFEEKDSPPLAPGPDRRGRLGWAIGPTGEQVAIAEAEEPGVLTLHCAAPFYVDPAAGLAGRLVFDQAAEVVAAFLRAPPVTPEQSDAVRLRLESRLTGQALPPPRTRIPVERVSEPPVPCLALTTHRLNLWQYYRPAARTETALDLASLTFDYGGTILGAGDTPKEMRSVRDGRIVIRRRDARAERAFQQRLAGLGLEPTGALPRPADPVRPVVLTMAGDDAAAWHRLVHRDLPLLRAEGWRVELAPEFRHRVVEASGDWEASLDDRGGWWFSLELGIEVEGERVALLPILAQAIARLRATARGGDILDGEAFYAPLPDGRVLALPMERLRPMLEALVELYDADALGKDGRLDISLGEAAALAAIAEATRLRWLGGSRLLDLVDRLRGAGAVVERPAPEGFLAELRPYQRQGLGWLELLAANGLGGVLADDMGLGKTIQTLAHILALKQAGRLDAPALVVCPTSLVTNWESEALRFAPSLRVLRLHGRERAGSFAAIREADLVLSTYALLPRDAEALLPVEWHLVVLDEAQAIKNPTSKVTQLACRLKGGHRLCLTGTPIENHLGELWSQLTFLMPGLLGDHRRFGRLFRTPIEKQGNAARRAALAARLRPFILRRTKEQVAPELPPRTEILRRIGLTGEQRDLYETVRLAMHERVRQEIAARGFERSRIIVLDALLKLRQVCCDPRLVKLAAARKVGSSSKLAYLLEMLPELIEEGRRVLLFSQFTSMLDLVRPELDRAGIRFVELRGDTEDRAAPVARFQAGKVPLFLISLKAGGFGLNLTAADTVILYDPWWNPAVEAQAADRAHRIGQEKPVFVYKLIAEGTIEERMLELQEKKRALAAGVLDEGGETFAGFGEADLELLLRPLDAEAG